MCTPKSENGGKRCKGSLAGSALYKLYRERKNAESGSDEFNELQEKIDRLKESRSLYGDCVAPYDLDLPEGVDEILTSARKVGNPLIVGGCVRDSFLGAENKDIDIEVHGTDIDSLISTLKDEGFRVDEVGKSFGVLKVSKKGGISDIDISVPRRENKVGAGHRGFEVDMDSEMTVEEAGARRDFTFNAVSYDPERKVLVDPYQGESDFQKKILRHVSPAFAEDPLRVLRAFQFAGRFGLKVDPDTAKMCQSLRSSYPSLSTERVIEEWEKFYTKSKEPLAAVKTLQETGWDDTISGLQESLKTDKSQHGLKALGEMNKSEKYDKSILGSAVIASSMDKKDGENFIRSTVLSTKRQQLAMTLSQFDPKTVQTEYNAKKYARDLHAKGFNFETYEKHCELVRDSEGMKACKLAKEAGVFDKFEQPLVQGRDILATENVKPGAWMGKLLAEVEDLQYRGKFKSKSEAMEYTLQRIPR